METTRQQKIAKQIQRDMAEIFQKEGAEIVRGVLVTVTAVRVSPDFHTPRSTSASFPSNRMPLSWPRWSSTIGSCAGHWVSGFGTSSRRSPKSVLPGRFAGVHRADRPGDAPRGVTCDPPKADAHPILCPPLSIFTEIPFGDQRYCGCERSFVRHARCGDDRAAVRAERFRRFRQVHVFGLRCRSDRCPP